MHQEILREYGDARLRVHVVWVRRWATDTRDQVDGAGLLDPRVVHYWDRTNTIGRQLVERLSPDVRGLDYDYWLLLDAGARWSPAQPPALRGSGGTVVATAGRLRAAAAPLLGRR
ncbi:MAG TPA: hypothetical protein VKG45_03375 [Actinomycetes bacterium]|nr:hypothetical protein [Actinomycetes bacterium]